MNLTIQPTMNTNRIKVIDVIRGFALIGLLFVNVLALWSSNINLSWTQADIWVQRFLYIFIDASFYAAFSLLFVLVIWIFLLRAIEKKVHPFVLFIRRMVILAIVGALPQLINPGAALLVHALMGISVVFLDKIPKKF